MKFHRPIAFILLIFSAAAYANDSLLVRLIETKRFQKLTQLHAANRYEHEAYRHVVEAVLLNARGEVAQSLTALKRGEAVSRDTSWWARQWWNMQYDNFIKQNRYRDAFRSREAFLKLFSSRLDSATLADITNTQKIWKALQNEKPQQVKISSYTRAPLTRDVAGLWNIGISVGGAPDKFVFDTGAGYSTIMQSVATQLGVRVLPGEPFLVKAGITGKPIEARIGVLDNLILSETIKCSRVVFLVFPDEMLSFAGGAYKIKGIIGLPVLAGLQEFTIRNDSLFVPHEPANPNLPSNLYIDQTKPVLYLAVGDDEWLPYTFDTGAKTTILNDNFYERYHDTLPWSGEQQINVGNAGGTRPLNIRQAKQILFRVGGTRAVLNDVEVSLSQIGTSDGIYFGNIGQDFISAFREMTINFRYNTVIFR